MFGVVCPCTSMFESDILGVLMTNTCWGKGVQLKWGDEKEDEEKHRRCGVLSFMSLVFECLWVPY